MTKLKSLKSDAKKYGLSFKPVNAMINGSRAYALFNLHSGLMVSQLTTLQLAYERQCVENYFSDYNNN